MEYGGTWHMKNLKSTTPTKHHETLGSGLRLTEYNLRKFSCVALKDIYTWGFYINYSVKLIIDRQHCQKGSTTWTWLLSSTCLTVLPSVAAIPHLISTVNDQLLAVIEYLDLRKTHPPKIDLTHIRELCFGFQTFHQQWRLMAMYLTFSLLDDEWHQL